MIGRCRLSCGIFLALSALLVSSGRADDAITSITEAFLLGALDSDALGVSDNYVKDLAERRASLLVENSRFQTAKVLSVVIPDSIVRMIDTSLHKYLEKRVELEGHLAATLFEFDDLSHAYDLTLQPTDGSATVFLHFSGPPSNLPIGRLVRVRGILLPELSENVDGPARHMILRPVNDAVEVISETGVSTNPSAVGRQRTGVFLARFSHDPSSLDNQGEWAFEQLDRVLRRHSLSRTWLLRKGTEQLEFAINRTCDREAIQAQLTEALAQSGKDVSAYDRIFLLLPSLTCSWRTVAVFPASPSVILVNERATTEELLRALLHSFGMPGYQTPACDFDVIYSECRTKISSELMQRPDVGMLSLSPYHKENVGWISVDSGGPISAVESGGMYRVWAADSMIQTRRLALKIARRAPVLQHETIYYVEYRVRKLDGNRLPPEVVLYLVNGDSVVETFNLTFPGPVLGELQSAISISEGKFVDHVAGLEIEVAQASPWTVDLDISLDPTACVRAAPNVELAPPDTIYISADTSTRFSVALSSRDSGDCEPFTPRLDLHAPDGWSVQQDSQALVLQPGETAQIAVTVTVPRDAGPGFSELRWIVRSEAPLDAHQSAMAFVLPSTGGTTGGGVSSGFDWLAQAADGPWNGLGVGIFLRTHSFGNQKFGPGRIQTIRFIAEKTGQVRGAMPYWQIQPQPGYSEGDGGKVAIYLYEADSSGQLGKKIGTGPVVSNPVGLCGAACTTVEFKLTDAVKPTITKGKQYHWVFEQVGSTGKISMGGLADQSADPARTGGMVPVFDDESMVHMFGYGTPGDVTLQVHGSKYPQFATVYTDGTHIGSEAHQGLREDAATVEGSNRIRIVIKTTTERTVRYVWAAPWKETNQSTKDVKVEVKNSNGAVLASALIPASAIGYDAPPAGGMDDDEKNGTYGKSDEKAPWVKAPLGTTLTLKAGQTYYVEFSAPAAADIHFMAMTESFDAIHENVRDARFSEARGQFSTNSGASWTNALYRGRPNAQGVYSVLLHYY
jgi:hypothetical protein